MKKQLYIIRGLPGSGKTTLAHTLSVHVCEADDFFYMNVDGIYKFDKEKIHIAHNECQNKVKKLMEGDEPIIAVSNTFVKRWEMMYYYGVASFYNYEVTEITMSGKLHGNIHEVPTETIARMKENWEK